jgi:ribosomal protein L11 methyltransferase
MIWYQLEVHRCLAEDVDRIIEHVEQFHPVSVTYTDAADVPILEPELGTTPLWPEVVLQVLFEAQPFAESALISLMAHYPTLQVSQKIIEDEDWQAKSMGQFQPQCYGENLWIYPDWVTEGRPLNKPILTLSPGLAFGTGTHPTTALCLTWLAKASIENQTVIDFGCGSGILGLSALKLGASHVTGIDIDEQALTSTKNNALINHIDETQLTLGYPQDLSEKAAILIANILLSPLLMLRDTFSSHLESNGLLVLSGILKEQVDELKQAYEDLFEHLNTEIQGDWALVVFRNNK